MRHERTKSLGHRGFTLIELLIVIAIIGIVSSISYGMYVDYIKDSHRSEAQSALLQFQQAMERFYTENNTYSGSHAGGTPHETVFPSTAPLGSENAKYNLSVTTTDSTYTLTATPIAGGIMEDDGALTLNHLGQKTLNGETGWDPAD